MYMYCVLFLMMCAHEDLANDLSNDARKDEHWREANDLGKVADAHGCIVPSAVALQGCTYVGRLPSVSRPRSKNV